MPQNDRSDHSGPPRVLRFLTGLAIPRAERPAALADLDDLYLRVRARSGSVRAWFWYARQVVSFPLTRAGFGLAQGARQSLITAWSADAARDVRHALRGVTVAPAFAGLVVVTLGLGIGAIVSLFSVVHGVLLQPLPFERPDRLVSVGLRAPGITTGALRQTAHTYIVIADGTASFEALGAWVPSSATVNGAGMTPERVPMAWLTQEILPAFRVAPALGRAFDGTDGHRGGSRTALLDHGYWASRFGSDPGVVGRSIDVNGEPTLIVGVMPAGFALPGYDASLYLPMVLTDAQAGPTISFDYRAVGRLANGATMASATADVDRVLPRTAERFDAITREQMERVGLRGAVEPLRDVVVGDSGTILWILFGAVTLVLLIAVTNVANLVLVRADGRERDVAIRKALGAPRLRLVREAVVEHGLLSLLGGGLGLLLATVGVPVLLAAAPATLPRAAEIGVDGSVVGFTLMLVVAATVVFGLVGLAGARIVSGDRVLHAGGRATAPRTRLRGRQSLVVVEVCLALVLIVGAGLLVRSMSALAAVAPGFSDPEQVLTFRLSIPPAASDAPERVPGVHARILSAVAAVPGVTDVGAVSGLPLEHRSNRNSLQARDWTDEPLSGFYKGVQGDYFAAMGIPLVAGRFLTDDDLRERRRVGLVSEGVARHYWGSAEAALGKYIRHDTRDPWREVVGVVGTVHDRALDRGEPGGAYWPVYLEQFVGFPWMVRRTLSYAVRVEGTDPTVFVPAIREAVWSVDPSLPLADLQTMASRVHRSTARTRFMSTLLGMAAAIALALGAIGTYGVLAHAVSRGRRDIGIRLALGARPGQVQHRVMVSATALVAAGMGLGLAISLGLARVMAGVVFGVDVRDPLTYAAAATVLLAAGLLAGWVPARRAARVDPMMTLRSE